MFEVNHIVDLKSIKLVNKLSTLLIGQDQGLGLTYISHLLNKIKFKKHVFIFNTYISKC